MRVYEENDYFGKSFKGDVADVLIDVEGGGELEHYYVEGEKFFVIYNRDGKEFTTSIELRDIIPFMRGDKI